MELTAEELLNKCLQEVLEEERSKGLELADDANQIMLTNLKRLINRLRLRRIEKQRETSDRGDQV